MSKTDLQNLELMWTLDSDEEAETWLLAASRYYPWLHLVRRCHRVYRVKTLYEIVKDD